MLRPINGFKKLRFVAQISSIFSSEGTYLFVLVIHVSKTPGALMHMARHILFFQSDANSEIIKVPLPLGLRKFRFVAQISSKLSSERMFLFVLVISMTSPVYTGIQRTRIVWM